MKKYVLDIVGVVLLVIVMGLVFTYRKPIAEILHIMAQVCWEEPHLCY